MVRVPLKPSQTGDVTSKNPMIEYMLKRREEHARNQEHDYSHVFRRKTLFELFRLSAIAMAIEFAYAAETSFVSPILLQIGVDHKHMTMAWGLSPLVGFFVSPLLGSVSDRCRLGWGRRRPFITLLAIGIFMGLLLVPHGKDIGGLFGDRIQLNQTDYVEPIAVDNAAPTSDFKFAIILTVMGMVLLDFSADTCQTPARTYLLDMCTPEDQPRALSMFTLSAGVGGTIGYAIGGIDWTLTSFGNYLGGNIPTVFGLVSIIFAACYVITVTAFREIPLRLIERDELLRPLSEAAIKNEFKKNHNAIYYVNQTMALESNGKEQGGHYASSPISYQNGNSKQAEAPTSSKVLDPESSESIYEEPISLCQYLKSIFKMPGSMRILAATNLFCWMSHVTYCLYFTDFVGEAVFHGDPAAPPNSLPALLYEEGVRFGCWGMCIYALSCSVYSVLVTKLLAWFGTKCVYISGILFYGVCMFALGMWPTKWGVLTFSISAGVLYGTIFTLPFLLVANYHAKNCFTVRNGETVPLKQSRGLGTDISIISSMLFIAQFIVALFTGPIVAYAQTTCAIMYASTILSFIAAVFASFVLYV